MKTTTHHQNEKDGFALLVVLFFVAAISTFLSMLAFSSSQRAFTARRLADQIRAKAQAEAGCELAYARLSTDWESRYDPSSFNVPVDEEGLFSEAQSAFSSTPGYSLSASDDTARYYVDVDPVGTMSAIVTSTGTCGAAEAVSIISVQDIGGSSPDGDILNGEAFEYAALSGGHFEFGGCGSIIAAGGEAKFHSNSSMNIRGSCDPIISLSSSIKIKVSNNVTVGGDLAAPNLQYNASKVTVEGTATEASVDIVEIPDIDLTPYYNWALKRGEVHNGFATSTSYTPNGGILWVEGDVYIDSHAVIYGSIIATGNIYIGGQASILPTTSAFCAASRDGDIIVTSTGTLNGLIYAKTGGFSYTANGDINGQIIVNGDIKKAGNSDILTSYEQYVPSPPEGATTTEYIAITAWQE
jgi:cytoskeletal protein CcmA (bactofilin family)